MAPPFDGPTVERDWRAAGGGQAELLSDEGEVRRREWIPSNNRIGE